MWGGGGGGNVLALLTGEGVGEANGQIYEVKLSILPHFSPSSVDSARNIQSRLPVHK